jgi:hypothetical protein
VNGGLTALHVASVRGQVCRRAACRHRPSCHPFAKLQPSLPVLPCLAAAPPQALTERQSCLSRRRWRSRRCWVPRRSCATAATPTGEPPPTCAACCSRAWRARRPSASAGASRCGASRRGCGRRTRVSATVGRVHRCRVWPPAPAGPGCAAPRRTLCTAGQVSLADVAPPRRQSCSEPGRSRAATRARRKSSSANRPRSHPWPPPRRRPEETGGASAEAPPCPALTGCHWTRATWRR